MYRHGGGAIVNTSSNGSRRANPAVPAYGVKRALNSITETAAVSWARDGNPRQRHRPRRHCHRNDRRLGGGEPGRFGAVTASIPLGWMVEPREVAAWLLSDRASHVTGAIVPVDGGASA